MIRGLYVSGTSMLVQRKKMDVLVNNIVNAETSGYKSSKLLSRSFRDMMISRVDGPATASSSRSIGPFSPALYIDDITTSFEQGPLEETERHQDLALVGDGFFTVETPKGERYTRDGHFHVSVGGFLMTSDGWPVLGEQGRIPVTDAFTVSEQGLVFVDDRYVDRLRLVSFEAVNSLRKDGSNLYDSSTQAAVDAAGQVVVKQGFLEGSNVDLSRTMVDLIQISRAHETNQRIIRMLDATLDKAVNEVGRVR